eukprot:scaffold3403_cov300-Pinguiococcus_pyrenoidosus.AAC.10
MVVQEPVEGAGRHGTSTRVTTKNNVVPFVDECLQRVDREALGGPVVARVEGADRCRGKARAVADPVVH